MKTIGSVIAAPLKLLGVIPPSSPQLPSPQLTPTRDEARARIMENDALRKRRGGAADMLTGASGSEAGGGMKQTLGS